MSDVPDKSFQPWERTVLALIGLVFAGAAGCAWHWPPLRTVAASQPSTGEASHDTISISSQPEPLVLALSAASILFLFLSMNGRRLASLKLPGGIDLTAMADEVKATERALAPKLSALAADPTDAPTAPQPQTTPTTTTFVDGVELGVYKLDDVPLIVFGDLLPEVRQHSEPSARMAVEFVARKSGRGNNPWAVKFRGDDRVWKVAYGGRGKPGATVTVI